MNKILESTKYVVDNSREVHINTGSIDALAEQMTQKPRNNWLQYAPFDIQNLDDDDRLHFMLIFDAISFSYWGQPKWSTSYNNTLYDGSWGLIASLGRALEKGRPLLSAKYLSSITDEEFNSITRGNIEIPLASDRATHLREIGNILKDRYDGRFRNFLNTSSNDACNLVYELAKTFPCFNDTAKYDDKEIYFFKRAQVLVADISKNLKDDKDIIITNPQDLTASADYKLPQILRHAGILGYSPELEKYIDSMHEIPLGSSQEVEIRANTVWAIQYISDTLKNKRIEINPHDINDMLWLQSQEKIPGIKPYHRTRTTYY